MHLSHGLLGALLVVELDEAVALVQGDPEHFAEGVEEFLNVLPAHLVGGQVANEHSGVQHFGVVAAGVSPIFLVRGASHLLAFGFPPGAT